MPEDARPQPASYVSAPPPKKKESRIAFKAPLVQTAERSLQTRKAINDIIKRTKAPFARVNRMPSPREVEELENSLRELEAQLLEREEDLHRSEARLVDRERDLWEAQALIAAKEKVLQARLESSFKAPSTPAPSAVQHHSPAETAALEEWKRQLDAREQSLNALRAELDEREAFVLSGEAVLFEKSMEQQEREAFLDQREEELKALALKYPRSAP